jgi:hypothetical protein
VQTSVYLLALLHIRAQNTDHLRASRYMGLLSIGEPYSTLTHRDSSATYRYYIYELNFHDIFELRNTRGCSRVGEPFTAVVAHCETPSWQKAREPIAAFTICDMLALLRTITVKSEAKMGLAPRIQLRHPRLARCMRPRQRPRRSKV